MSQEQINITDMQCRLFRMAQREWHLSPSECTDLFRNNKVFDFISDCYDSLHLSSYQRALEDVKELLLTRGIAV